MNRERDGGGGDWSRREWLLGKRLKKREAEKGEMEEPMLGISDKRYDMGRENSAGRVLSPPERRGGCGLAVVVVVLVAASRRLSGGAAVDAADGGRAAPVLLARRRVPEHGDPLPEATREAVPVRAQEGGGRRRRHGQAAGPQHGLPVGADGRDGFHGRDGNGDGVAALLGGGGREDEGRGRGPE